VMSRFAAGQEHLRAAVEEQHLTTVVLGHSWRAK
jgi:hypothetical protein